MRTLVVGLGNPLLTDDGVGLVVARALRDRLPDRRDVDVQEDFNGGLRLMERMVGYDRAIVVDAILTGGMAGSIQLLRGGNMPTQHSASSHDATLRTALDFGRSVGAALPLDEEILMIGIEAADVSTFGTCCTPEVQAAVPAAVETVLLALQSGET
jgi:hydrogenase maturation protease